MIKKCTCIHEYQDEKYGTGKRVHNALASNSGHPRQYRCTVCGDIKTQSLIRNDRRSITGRLSGR